MHGNSRIVLPPQQPLWHNPIQYTDHHKINIEGLFGGKHLTCGKGLIVVPGHGANQKRREIIRNNTRHIPFDRFDCLVFIYDGRITDKFDFDECRVILKRGSWVDFQWMVAPDDVLSAGYTSVTLILDDVLLEPSTLADDGRTVNFFDRMQYLLETEDLSALSPNILGSSKSWMSLGLGLDEADPQNPKLTVKRHRNGYTTDIPSIEIQMVMFSVNDSGWPCHHSMFDPSFNNSVGWGPDICYKAFCKAKLGLFDAVAIHFGQPTVFGKVPTTNTVGVSFDVAKSQQNQWAMNYVTEHLPDWPSDPSRVFQRCRAGG